MALADEVSALIGWLRQDILSVPGPDYASRCALYDWIVAELRMREPPCPDNSPASSKAGQTPITHSARIESLSPGDSMEVITEDPNQFK